MSGDENGLALVLSGGGARAAYQVGFLRCLARNVFRWGLCLISGGIPKESSAKSLLDPTPLRELLQRALSPQENVITGIRKKLHHQKSIEDANTPACIGYPPHAQIAGPLMNSIFLDALDQDVRTLKRTNQLLEKIPEERRGDRHVVHHFVMRPSEDLGKLAGGFNADRMI
jgi:hypothetical protein